MSTNPANIDEVELPDRLLRAYDEWQESLMDLSGRNPLVSFRDLKAGTLTLKGALVLKGKAGERKLETLPLLTDPERSDTLNRARTLARTHLGNLEERGVSTLRLACSLVSWSVGSKKYRVPVLLQNLDCPPETARVHSSGVFNLRDDDVEVNPNLGPLLKSVVGLPGGQVDELVSGWNLLVTTTLDDASTPVDELGRMLAASLVEVLGGLGAVHEDVCVIGNFNHSKLPMVQDLEAARRAEGPPNLLVSALAGDFNARASLARSGDAVVDARLPNYVAPSTEALVLDADSSQSMAVTRVLKGQSLVVQGPPGTGKSQTIANLIASLVAEGKSVLFVAEKKAAIEAVTGRLGTAGLGHLLLELHGKTTDKKWFYEKIHTALENHKSVLPPAREEKAFLDARRALVEASDVLHSPLPGWDRSAYAVMGRVLHLRAAAAGRVPRLPTKARVLTQERLDAVLDLFRAYGDLGGFDPAVRSSGWFAFSGSSSDVSAVNDAVDWVVGDLKRARGVFTTSTNGPVESIEELTRDVGATLELSAQAQALGEEVLSMDLKTAAGIFAGKKVDASGSKVGWWSRRKLKKSVRTAVPATTPSEELPARLASAAGLGAWRVARWGKDLPSEDLTALREASAALRAVLDVLTSAFPEQRVRRGSLTELADLCERLDAEQASLAGRMPRLRELEWALEALSLGSLLSTVVEREADTEHALELVELAFLQVLEEQVRLNEPLLANLSATQLENAAVRFRDADAEHVRSKAASIDRAAAERLVKVLDREPSQYQYFRAAHAKSRRQPPLRDLVANAFDVLRAAQPCWAMSPLEVSQVLPLASLFDVVVFDEASQVRPHEAVSALLRSDQVVVAGDRHQLPPTTFFASGENEGGSEMDDYESLLDAMNPFLRNCLLSWHYRSQDERLIATSNAYIYANSLTTFPGVGGLDAVEFVEVDGPVLGDGKSSDAEVVAVVEQLRKEAAATPGASIGIITPGQEHADRIQAAVDRAVQAGDKVLEDLTLRRSEPLFVKGIERVQGDERDVIVISMGYTKADGKLRQNFGPINQEGGERRLNVMASRAKKRMVLVASFNSGDVSAVSTRRGVQVLRGFFEFMERGGVLTRNEMTDVELNPFELDIRDKLEARFAGDGVTVVPQYGCSGYRIDFALTHPEREGAFVLAVEADGASYHSLPTARDRDRLRQEHLERLGWTFHRIWSTAWFRDSATEAEKVHSAYQAALRALSAPAASSGVVALAPAAGVQDKGAAPRSPEQCPVRLVAGAKLEQYSDRDLERLATWVLSDDHLRTSEGLLVEMMQLLGLTRRGSRIVERLTRAAERARRS